MAYLLERVDSLRRQRDFYLARKWVYRRDPVAVLPLRAMEWALLDPDHHPFFQHARREIWVAYDGKRPVGRIAAIIDHLFDEHYQDRMGFFGFFETPDDPECAQQLLNTAREWLIRQGCRAIRGPVSPSMKGEFGVLVDGHEYPPFVMMAHSPPYYDRILQNQGLTVAKRFFAFLHEAHDWVETQRNQQTLAKVCDRILRRYSQISIRSATRENLRSLVREINQKGNEVRSRGWGFVPVTDAELDYLVNQLTRIIQPRTVIAAYWNDRLVGYNISIPNVNWAVQRARGSWDWLRYLQLAYWLPRVPQVRTIAIGVDENYRAKGLATLLTKAMVDLGPEFEKWEFSWIAEDNLASLASLQRAVPMNRYKTYHVYEQAL